MTEFWEREYPWPVVGSPMYSRFNRQMVLDLGNGWRASLVTEIDWLAMQAQHYRSSDPWPHEPGLVEVGFLRPPDGLHELVVEWADDDTITAVRVPDGPEEAYGADQVARRLTMAQLDQLLTQMAAL